MCAGSGFLLAVLWFDLMFDVQARRTPVTPETVRSIGTYYRRVTTDAAPMNVLVATAMLVTMVALVVEIVIGPRAAGIACLPLVALAVGLATTRTVPTAVRIGQTEDHADPGVAVACRTVLRDHQMCFVLILTVLVIQLVSAA